MIIIDETGIEFVLVIFVIVVVGTSLADIGTIAIAIADIGFVIDEQEFLRQMKYTVNNMILYTYLPYSTGEKIGSSRRGRKSLTNKRKKL